MADVSVGELAERARALVRQVADLNHEGGPASFSKAGESFLGSCEACQAILAVDALAVELERLQGERDAAVATKELFKQELPRKEPDD
jgi:hypothetical protein